MFKFKMVLDSGLELTDELKAAGWQYCSRSKRYVMHPSGKMMDLRDGELLSKHTNADGYLVYCYRAENGEWRNCSEHRLLMETFVPIPEELKGVPKLVVNHLDTIRSNNDLSNLEWTTYRGNHIHAGFCGTTDRCVPLETKNVLTGEIVYYDSATACGEALGMSKDQILYRLDSDGQKIFPEMLLYKKYHSKSEWMTVPDEIVVEFGRKRKVDVRFLETNLVETYESAREASKVLGCSEAAMTKWLNLPNQPVLPGLVQMKFHHDKTPWRVVVDMWEELGRSGTATPIIVKDVLEDKVFIFPSFKYASVHLGIGISTIHDRVKRNPGKIFGRLAFGYYPGDKGSVLAATLK